MKVSLNMTETFPYPVWYSQRFGLVKDADPYRGGKYIFIEPPRGMPEFKAGDSVPKNWRLYPANVEAGAPMEDEFVEFGSIDTYHDRLVEAIMDHDAPPQPPGGEDMSLWT